MILAEMKARYLQFYAVSTFFLALCFMLSLIIIPRIEGGFKMKFHPALAMYAIIAVIFVVEALRRSKFRAEGFETVYVFGGLTIGTIGILNIVLVNPWLGQNLAVPWIITLVVIFYFRHLFFPFHSIGLDFIKNLAVGAGILCFVKLIVLWGLFTGVPLVGNYLGIGESFKDHYDLGIMSVIWLVGILFYGAGLFWICQTIRSHNEEMLRSIRDEIALSRSDMVLLGLSNQDLMGRSAEEIEDIINERVRGVVENYSKYHELEEFAGRNNHNRKRWVSAISGLLEYKPNR